MEVISKKVRRPKNLFRKKFIHKMIRLGLRLWKTRASFETKEIKDIIVLHFPPEYVPEPGLMALKESFIDPYVELSGKDPIVIALPYGYKISSLNVNEFLEVLNHDQRNAFQTALYERKKEKNNHEKLELVK